MYYVNQNELYHYGIMGMKWGVRRYQNEDGSYTAAGRARYGISEAGRKVKGAAEKAAGSYVNAREKAYERRGKSTLGPKSWRPIFGSDYGRPTDRKQRSENQLLDTMGGRKINASYETRRERGKKLKVYGHRSKVGAVGRHMGRAMGMNLISGALETGLSSMIPSPKGKQAVRSLMKAGRLAFTASSVIKTYQDISDIKTYEQSQRKTKKRKASGTSAGSGSSRKQSQSKSSSAKSIGQSGQRKFSNAEKARMLYELNSVYSMV